MKRMYIVMVSAMIMALPGCLKQKSDDGGGTPPPPPRTYNWPSIADSVQAALNNSFWYAAGNFFTSQPNGTSFNSNYWPNAHALDVLTDAYLRKNKDANVKAQMDKLVDGLKAANGNSYSNYYFDDMEWLLISSLRAFKETGDTKYKTVYESIWPEVKTGWDNVSGGGFYWRKDKINKNTPANAPACIFAARLYQLTNNTDDLDWAKNTYNWLKTHMIQSNGSVWDGLNTNVTPITYDNRLFTYNNGTVIGSALELYKITNDVSYKNDAVNAANAAITGLTREGVLVPGDTGDGGLFNGIFVRYLTRLIAEGDIDSGTKTNYINFLKKNAETMWSKGTLFPLCFVGPDWKVTPSTTTMNPQLSGAMLAESLAELKKLNLLPN